MKIAQVDIATDFLDYISRNWCESTISKPTSLKVFNFNRERQIQGYINSALLVHRGQLQFIPLDTQYEARTWDTNILLHATTSTILEDYIIEFQRTLNSWEAAGGGIFTTGSIIFTSMEPVNYDIVMKTSAVGSLSFFSKQAARNT